MTYESLTEQNTFDIALNMARNCTSGQVYCLNGDLGTGKTIFAKGFASGLNITQEITSPTYTLVNEYTTGILPFYHFDVYRINHISEMDETGYEDYFYGNGVCLVEWAELVLELIPPNAIFITIQKRLDINEDYRLITIKGLQQ